MSTAAVTSTTALVLSDILARTPVADLDSSLSRSLIIPTLSDVDSVLKLSYPHPAAAVNFFRWASQSLHPSPLSPLSWNLIVDILGKNSLFEAMWDAIRSMKQLQQQPSPLSVSTFSSAFSSYCIAGNIKEAIMTFDVMDRYGVPQNLLALNSLLSAICRLDAPHTADAADVFDRVKANIAPDSDTFAILLEGWEKEGNVQRAKNTFGEMVIRIGWDERNMSAYDAFLTTLVRGKQPDEAIKFLKVMKGKNCLPGLKFFANALDILVKSNDVHHTLALWELMVEGSGLVPNLVMYNAVIALICNHLDFDSAYRFLDAMPFHGAFPDSLTYNMIFECLVRNRKRREAEKFLAEMRKNEKAPSVSNSVAAIRLFFEEFDPSAAIEVWNCAVPDEECGNELLLGLAKLGRLSEVRRYADEMLDVGVRLWSATMEKLRLAFIKGHKEESYERIERRVKRRVE